MSVTPLLYFARDKKTLDLSVTSEKFPEEGLSQRAREERVAGVEKGKKTQKVRGRGFRRTRKPD